MLLRNPAHKNDYIPTAELEEISSTPLDIVQAIQNSQDSEITITLSSPSQNLSDDFELTDCFFGLSSSDLAGPDERRLIVEGFGFLSVFKWFLLLAPTNAICVIKCYLVRNPMHNTC